MRPSAPSKSIRSALRAKVAAATVLTSLAAALPVGVAQTVSPSHANHGMAATAMGGPVSRAMDVQPTIGRLALIDSNGEEVLLRDAVTADVPVLLNFIFTSCTTICPVMSAGFKQLAERLSAAGRDVRLVSISIDPEVDTPARLREYAARVGAGANWRFLTGSMANVEAAQQAFGAFRGLKESHAALTFIRRSGRGPWEQLDGLAGVETLERAYTGVPKTTTLR